MRNFGFKTFSIIKQICNKSNHSLALGIFSHERALVKISASYSLVLIWDITISPLMMLSLKK
jgi:hypothetical protein